MDKPELTKTDLEVLTHLRDKNAWPPEATGRGANLTNRYRKESRAKLLKAGYLSPASNNRVVINSKGLNTLKAAEQQTE